MVSEDPTKLDEFTNVSTKSLIANFEKSPVGNPDLKETEKPQLTPGGAKKLLQQYQENIKAHNQSPRDVETPVTKPGAAKQLLKEYEERSNHLDSTAVQRKDTAHTVTPNNGLVVKTHDGLVVKTHDGLVVKTHDGLGEMPPGGGIKHNVLLVFAHPEMTSFNGLMMEEAVQRLRRQGHEVAVSDLYQMDWQCPSRADAGDSQTSFDTFYYEDVMHHALTHSHLAQEIVEEQRKIAAADLVLLQYPVTNMGFPAIVKAWIERVMTKGFAFKSGDQPAAKGLMKGKKLLLSMTTEGVESEYSEHGALGDICKALWCMEYGAFHDYGFDIRPSTICYGMSSHHSSDFKYDASKQYLHNWSRRLNNIWEENAK